eukprot:6823659-Alexandrium_andersonii.AAC.1
MALCALIWQENRLLAACSSVSVATKQTARRGLHPTGSSATTNAPSCANSARLSSPRLGVQTRCPGSLRAVPFFPPL